MSQSPILIIGATGTNGRALIESLEKKNTPVRALVRNVDSAQHVLPTSVELVEGDLTQPDSLRRAFAGVDQAFVVTGVQPDTVALFRNVYAAAREADVSQLVKFSGLGASASSDSEIMREHGISDDLLRESGVPFTVIRPNSFHQNMLWQAQSIAQTDHFYLPLADAAQSTIDVRDIADIVVKLMTEEGHVGKAYDLTGPESLTFHDVARIIGDLRGKPVTYVPVSRDAAESAMREQGMPDWSAKALAEIQALFSTGTYSETRPEAERLLGRPLKTFEDFARDHIDLFAPATAPEA